MKVTLEAGIDVLRRALFAEMAWMERRPELGLLCRAARETGDRIHHESVRSVLPGIPDAGVRNVIDECRLLGLCDAQGALTACGHEAAESDTAPVPEQGVYDVWMVQHPLLGRRVLAAERLAAGPDGRFESLTPLTLTPDVGRVFRSVTNPEERFLVRNLDTNSGQVVAHPRATRATCTLRWTLDFEQQRNQWQLSGTLDAPNGIGTGGMRAFRNGAETEPLDLWEVAASWGAGPLADHGRWRADARWLAVAFEDLEPEAIRTFRKSFALSRVEIPGKGEFHDVRLEDVPLGPASAQDAQRWAMARLDQHLASNPGYHARDALRDAFVDQTEKTCLDGFGPTLPSHAEMLASAEKDRPRFWSLAAPVDLSPVPVPSEALEALQIGAPARTPAVETGTSVRVPYGSRESMGRLVTRLLLGLTPRKVLLCDRYVRGEDNLRALARLVDAIRAHAPSASVAVWTDEKDGDFKRIQALTGSAPRGYHAAFGKSIPHDRYLLVLPDRGAGFGWQLSNSPLHARAAETAGDDDASAALRWKDLVATRVEAEQLAPAMRDWILGGGR